MKRGNGTVSGIFLAGEVRREGERKGSGTISASLMSNYQRAADRRVGA